jgi:hypothetical protein
MPDTNASFIAFYVERVTPTFVSLFKIPEGYHSGVTGNSFLLGYNVAVTSQKNGLLTASRITS